MHSNSLKFLLLLAAGPVTLHDVKADEFPSSIQPFFQKYCVDCHGKSKQHAGVRLDQLTEFRPSDKALWTSVHNVLTTNEMPPRTRPQPLANEKKQLTTWLEAQFATSSRTGPPLRRLNRRELSFALQDVVGLPIDYASMLPGDGSVKGFDTGADGLQDAADSITQFLEVTRRAVSILNFTEKSPRTIYSVDLTTDVKDPRKLFDPWKAAGIQAKNNGPFKKGSGLLVEPRAVGERGGYSLYLPATTNKRGVLRLRLHLSRIKPQKKIPDPHFWLTIGGKQVDLIEITNDEQSPRVLEYFVHWEELAVDAKGLPIHLENKVEVPYQVTGYPNDEKVRPGEVVPGGTGLFRPLYDRKQLRPEEQPVPYIVIHRLDLEPDFHAPWPPPSWKMNLPAQQPEAERTKALIRLFLERAWRHPVNQKNCDRFEKLCSSLQQDQHLTSDQALRATFQAILMSSGFRYLANPCEAEDYEHYALASRLSFLLWAAPPDQELLLLAREGKLRETSVLEKQIERLLADPRSDQFLRPFVDQWLELDQPITLVMDNIKKQDFRFGRHLKESMKEETRLYFSRMVRENLPAKELLASDWTFMNNILARHYGYPERSGRTLQVVKLRPEDPRGGGILGHAGIQSMLCWMGDNWVIYRGAWALRHIFDDPPPPPPLEVPELAPFEGNNQGKSFKQLLEQHQKDPNCAVCHRKMDPLGFAFQNFDLSGRWREQEFARYTRNELDGKIEWLGAGTSRPVDAVGTLPRGETFHSFKEFKELSVKHYTPDLVRGLLKNLYLVSTGVPPEVHGMIEIRKIMVKFQDRGFPLRELLKNIILNERFLARSEKGVPSSRQ